MSQIQINTFCIVWKVPTDSITLLYNFLDALISGFYEAAPLFLLDTAYIHSLKLTQIEFKKMWTQERYKDVLHQDVPGEYIEESNILYKTQTPTFSYANRERLV